MIDHRARWTAAALAVEPQRQQPDALVQRWAPWMLLVESVAQRCSGIDLLIGQRRSARMLDQHLAVGAVRPFDADATRATLANILTDPPGRSDAAGRPWSAQTPAQDRAAACAQPAVLNAWMALQRTQKA